MADLRPELFADDVLGAPATLAAPAPRLESIRRLAGRARRVLFLGISATGGSDETVAAMRSHLGTSMVVGVTSVATSAIGSEADACLEIAGDGPSGVACASYRSTVAVLRDVCGLLVPAAAPPTGWRERAAAAAGDLLDRRGEWLPRTV